MRKSARWREGESEPGWIIKIQMTGERHPLSSQVKHITHPEGLSAGSGLSMSQGRGEQALYSTKRKCGGQYKGSGVQLKASDIKRGTFLWMAVDDTLNISIASDSDFS